MMKYLAILATILLTSLGVFAQTFSQRTNGTFTPVDPFLSVPRALYIPRSCDTTTALNGGKDTTGAMVWDTCNNKLWIRAIKDGVKYWSTVTNNTVDVFLVSGQSNAQGWGDSALSPKVIPGKILQVNRGVISNANDPIGINVPPTGNSANTGSAWPAFGISYYNNTGRIICFVPSSRASSSQTAATNTGAGTWDTTGVLFDSAVARVVSGMTILRNVGYEPIFKGVLWSQGETDAIGINSSTITQAAYITAFQKMLRRFRQQFGATMPFYIFRTGTQTAASDVGYDLIRKAQQYVADNDSLTQIVFYNTVDFPTRSLLEDDIHYNQVGLNEMGTLGALSVANNIKNNWQSQLGNTYYGGGGNVGIGYGSGLPVFPLQVIGGAKADTLYGGSTSGDSLTLISTSHATRGRLKFLSKSYFSDTIGVKNESPVKTVDVNGTIGASDRGYPLLNGSLPAIMYAVHGPGNWGSVVTRATDDGGSANFVLYKTRSTTASTRVAPTSGDGIGSIVYMAPVSGNNNDAAGIRLRGVAGTPGVVNVPMSFVIETDDGTALTERMRISTIGNFYIGGPVDATYGFHVNRSMAQTKDSSELINSITSETIQLIDTISGKFKRIYVSNLPNTESTESSVSSYTNYTTTATYQNIASITLSPGEWSLSAQGTFSSNSATLTAASNAIFVISTTTASAAGSTEGKNISYVSQSSISGTSLQSVSISPYTVSPVSSTTYYFNTQATFVSGNPQFVGTIRAKRIQ